MKVNTKAFGPIDIDDRQIIRFPGGLYGFEKFKDYALLDADQKPFFWLQSIDVQEIAFVLIDPFLIRSDYRPDVSDGELADIGVKAQDDALVLAIVTIPQGTGPITANLMGPLVINRHSRLAIQTIVQDSRWKTKHDIMDELSRGAGKAPC
jgi:flagellar assembly factor FliW